MLQLSKSTPNVVINGALAMYLGCAANTTRAIANTNRCFYFLKFHNAIKFLAFMRYLYGGHLYKLRYYAPTNGWLISCHRLAPAGTRKYRF